MTDKTSLFDVEKVKSNVVKGTLLSVFEDLEERGYNPINQIVGYLLSGDPGYITSYKEARNKITKLERSEIIQVLLESYLK